MNCGLSNEKAMKYFDGDLNDIEGVQFKQHLKVCKKCGEEFREMKDIFELLEHQDAVEPPEDFEVRVMEKVGMLEGERKKRSDRVLVFLNAAAALFLIALSVAIYSSVQEVSLLDTVRQIWQSFDSISSAMLTVYNLGRAFYMLVTGVLGALVHASVIIIKTYYYIFAALLIMYLIVQRMFINMVRHGSGGIR